MRAGAPRGIPGRGPRSNDDPTIRPRMTMARSVAVAARTYATTRCMSVSALVEQLILTDDVDRFGRPRWAVAVREGGRRLRYRSSDDPTRIVQLSLGRSIYLTGRVHAAGAGLTFSGYVEELIRREVFEQAVAGVSPVLEKTA